MSSDTRESTNESDAAPSSPVQMIPGHRIHSRKRKDRPFLDHKETRDAVDAMDRKDTIDQQSSKQQGYTESLERYDNAKENLLKAEEDLAYEGLAYCIREMRRRGVAQIDCMRNVSPDIQREIMEDVEGYDFYYFATHDGTFRCPEDRYLILK